MWQVQSGNDRLMIRQDKRSATCKLKSCFPTAAGRWVIDWKGVCLRDTQTERPSTSTMLYWIRSHDWGNSSTALPDFPPADEAWGSTMLLWETTASRVQGSQIAFSFARSRVMMTLYVAVTERLWTCVGGEDNERENKHIWGKMYISDLISKRVCTKHK